MRDKILHILSAIPCDTGAVWGERLRTHYKAADELTALMCYREARAILVTSRKFFEGTNPSFEFFFSILGEYYPEQTIREAIEKVKNEQK